MTEATLSTGIEYFPDPSVGRPLFNGTIFVGIVDLDPTVEANRISVTVIQEDGTRVVIAPAAQPLVTNSGGQVTYAGEVVSVFVSGSYSLMAYKNNGSKAYYVPVINELVIHPSSNFYIDTGTANAYILTATGSTDAGSAYVDGFLVEFRALANNTGASTVDVSGLGLKTIIYSGVALLADAIRSGEINTLMFDAANDWFELVGLPNVFSDGVNLDVNGDITANGLSFGESGFAASKLYRSTSLGTVLSCSVGTSTDFLLATPSGASIFNVPKGTKDVNFLNSVGIGFVTPATPATLLEVSSLLDDTAILRLTSLKNDSSHITGGNIGALEFYSGEASGAGVGVRAQIRALFTETSGSFTELAFHTSNAGNINAEQMRLANDGGLYMAGVTGASQGPGTINVTELYKNGIIFATSGATEGVWTPSLADSSFSASKGQTYISQIGSYTKIGRSVWFSLRIRMSSLGTLDPTDVASIIGLPFNAQSNAEILPAISCEGFNLSLPGSVAMTGIVFANTDYMVLSLWDSPAGASGMLISEVTANADLRISGYYQTD